MQALRSGDWLTPERMRLGAGLTAFVTAALPIVLLLGGHGTVDADGRPIGTDFSNVWAAGRMADQGAAAAAWDWSRHYAVQQALHGPDVPFYGWHYPPPFLLLAAPLAALSYLTALALWLATTIAAAILVVRRIVPGRDTLLVALGFPAVFVCLGHGQNGFLSAALLGGGLLLLERRPWLAGVLIGCLCYKPQFAPVLPVLLLTGGHGRAIAGVVATVLLLVAVTTALWGVAVWQAFAASLPLTRHVIVENTNTGAYKIVSAFAAVRLNGGGVTAAYLIQAVASAAAIGALVVARQAPPNVRYALAVTGALIATPYAFDYDTVILGIALAFLIAEARTTGWRPWERSTLACAYLTPLVGRWIAQATGLPLGLLAITAVWGVALGRTSAGEPPIPTPLPCRR